MYASIKIMNHASIKDAFTLLIHAVQFLELQTKPDIVSEADMDHDLLMNLIDSVIAAFRTLFSVGSMISTKDRRKVMRE